jgi:AcrR family transcriptional regulator
MNAKDSVDVAANRPKRADARRNEEALLDAAAAVFATSGVEAPIRDIAAKAGVGTATIYRHFPQRADLVVAVYRHQVEACAHAAPALLSGTSSPYVALAQWIDLFVDFVVTKQGLAALLQSDDPRVDPLHTYFLEQLVPVCAQLLDAATESEEVRTDVEAVELMRGVGSLCAGANRDTARRLVALLIGGLRQH